MLEINVTSQNFNNEVLHSDRPVLVDFWAPWCGPCKMLGPVMKEIAEEHPEIKVCKVNVDNEVELAGIFHVASIPMVVVMKDGRVTNAFVGYRPKEQIVQMI